MRRKAAPRAAKPLVELGEANPFLLDEREGGRPVPRHERLPTRESGLVVGLQALDLPRIDIARQPATLAEIPLTLRLPERYPAIRREQPRYAWP
jgi:hypothetical protein